MTYEEALLYLEAHVNLEALPVADPGVGRSLDRMARLVHVMDDPQHAYPVLHLTGTNGKGSTARMLTALLGAQGLSVGTYTSPHLERINERLAYGGEPIADEEFASLVEAVSLIEPLIGDRPSHFEILTSAAFRWFADLAVDVAVVEVGLGGRWDATNVADGQVAVVTNVELDHEEYLGPTRRSAAEVKAGIIKPESFLVLGETDPDIASIFRDVAGRGVWARDVEFGCEVNRPAYGGRLVDLRTPGAEYEEVFLPVHGAHQGDNAALALAAAEAFFGAPLLNEVVAEAFAGLRLPGRLEVVARQPLVVLDGAHNPAGAHAAAAAIDEAFGDTSGRVLVTGMLRGRDPDEMLAALGADRARLVIACPPPSPRALPAADVAAAASRIGVATEIASSAAEAVALSLAMAEPDDLVVVTGSLYVVGEARAALTRG